MRLEITVRLNNAAFTGDPLAEAKRIIDEALSRRMLTPTRLTPFTAPLLDSMGNTAGRITVAED